MAFVWGYTLLKTRKLMYNLVMNNKLLKWRAYAKNMVTKKQFKGCVLTSGWLFFCLFLLFFNNR